MNNSQLKTREVKQIINGEKTSDGNGVHLTRYIGGSQLDVLDPFLLMDVFGSDRPADYIGGFPSHPHRGFETVTYMLAGKMKHQDNAGHSGIISAGDIQWMSAGKGIVHSEMPEQENGLLQGIQLWVNLPRAKKMSNPNYQEYRSEQISVETRLNNCSVKVIAGTTQQETMGIIDNSVIQPIYWDILIDNKGSFEEVIPEAHKALVYVIDGEVVLGENESQLKKGQMAILGEGNMATIKTNLGARFVLIAGKPIQEPIVKGGPFVMNTREEIHQAFADYQAGKF